MDSQLQNYELHFHLDTNSPKFFFGIMK